MPREGIQFDVDGPWRTRVLERLSELGETPAWLARESGCPKSTLSELLSGLRHTTTYLPEIHEVLGFPPPLGPLLSRDDEEILRYAHRLSPEQKARLLERAMALEEEQNKKR